MKAIIPVKKSSIRVENKNFKPFYKEQSLFDIKVNSLLKTIDKSDIYVSGESEEIKKIAEKYELNFLIRDQYYAKNETPMAEVITHLVNRLPDDDDVMWVQVTEPFFEDFSDCLEKWENVKENHDSLVVVKPFQSYMLNGNGEPINFGFGVWHKFSQILPKWYLLPFSLQIIKRETVKKCSYYIGTKPYLYEFNNITFDIDSEEDFEQAKAIYKVVKEFKPTIK
jgi:N-acylneuraminate cytidylyltransferase